MELMLVPVLGGNPLATANGEWTAEPRKGSIRPSTRRTRNFCFRVTLFWEHANDALPTPFFLRSQHQTAPKRAS